MFQSLTVSNEGVYRGDVSPPQAVTPGHHTVQVQVPEDPGQVPEQRRVPVVVWRPEEDHQVPEGGHRVCDPRGAHLQQQSRGRVPALRVGPGHRERVHHGLTQLLALQRDGTHTAQHEHRGGRYVQEHRGHLREDTARVSYWFDSLQKSISLIERVDLELKTHITVETDDPFKVTTFKVLLFFYICYKYKYKYKQIQSV